jgi:hypothetical protein
VVPEKSGETASVLQEFCVNLLSIVLHRGAIGATGAPANRLMQLMLQKSVFVTENPRAGSSIPPLATTLLSGQ